MAGLMLLLCLGLVVEPTDVVRVAGLAFALFVTMQLVRWLMVQLLLLRSSFTPKERRFICWTGLRGALPISMAIQAWHSTASWGELMPPLALSVVLLGLLIKGFALVPIAHRLDLVLPSNDE